MRKQILYGCNTDQHAEEPQVHPVVFIEPGPINIKSMGDEAKHGVVSGDDQYQQNKCADHHPTVEQTEMRNDHIFMVTFAHLFHIGNKEILKTENLDGENKAAHPLSHSISQPMLTHRLMHQQIKNPYGNTAGLQ